MSGLYFYCGEPTTLSNLLVAAEDDLMDFSAIGVYNDPAEATNNTNRLNNHLANATGDIRIKFGGPATYAGLDGLQHREPGVAHFNGTIVLPPGKSFQLDLGNSTLNFTGLAEAQAAIDMQGGGNGIQQSIHSGKLISTGSGILIQSPGKGTSLYDVRIECNGADGTFTLDDYTDLGTAPFGWKVRNNTGITQTPDSLTLRNVTVYASRGHGIIIENQLNDGYFADVRVHGVPGCGMKAEGIRGGTFDITLESCAGPGYMIQNSGHAIYDSGSLIPDATGAGVTGSNQSILNLWCESNNWRKSTYTQVNGVREGRLDRCSTLLIGGKFGWKNNKVQFFDEGTRNLCRLVERMHNEQSVNPIIDLNNESDSSPQFLLPHEGGAVTNWLTVWPSPSHDAYRPTVTVIGSTAQQDVGFRVTIPVGCFDNAVGSASAYWRPWGHQTLFSRVDGDTFQQDIQVRAQSTALPTWCEGRESADTNRQGSTFGIIGVAPFGGGLIHMGLYNTQSRRFSETLGTGTGLTQNATPELVAWASGFQNQASYPQNTALVYEITDWRFYGIRAAGGSVT